MTPITLVCTDPPGPLTARFDEASGATALHRTQFSRIYSTTELSTVVALPMLPLPAVRLPPRPGVTTKRLDPMLRMRLVISALAPSPRATMTITAVTPITTPSTVRSERNGLDRKPPKAARNVSRMFISLPPSRRQGPNPRWDPGARRIRSSRRASQAHAESKRPLRCRVSPKAPYVPAYATQKKWS